MDDEKTIDDLVDDDGNLIFENFTKEQLVKIAYSLHTQLHQDKGILLEALHFYADPESYFAVSVIADRPSGGFADDYSDVVKDGWESFNGHDEDYRYGKLARETLNKFFDDNKDINNSTNN